MIFKKNTKSSQSIRFKNANIKMYITTTFLLFRSYMGAKLLHALMEDDRLRDFENRALRIFEPK
jgi:hypothetical protein